MSEENMSHLFLECEMVKRFLEYTLNLSGIAELLKDKGLHTNWYETINKRQCFVLGMCRKVVWPWDLRNMVKFKGLTPDIKSFKINF
jgi:hypothetical protein